MPATPATRRGFLDVRDVGVVGDGSDVTSMVSAAISRASTRPGVLFFPNGTYRLTNTVALRSGVRLVFAPGAVIDASGLSGTQLFLASNVDYWGVEGVRVTGLGASKTFLQADDSAFFDVSGVIVESGGSGVTLNRCTDLAVHGNSFTLTRESGTGHGVNVAGSNASPTERFRVTENTVINTNQTRCHGVYWYGGDAAVTTNIGARYGYVAGNTIVNVVGGVWGTCGQWVEVAGNQVNGCSDVGVDFEACQDCTATGNTVHNSANGGLAALYDCKRIAFTGNVTTSDSTADPTGGLFTDSSSLCVNLRDACEDISFHGNTFVSLAAAKQCQFFQYDNDATPYTSGNGCRRVQVVGNRFINGCMWFSGGNRDVRIESNFFYAPFDTVNKALVVQYSEKVIVRGNLFDRASSSSKSGADVYGPISLSNGNQASSIELGSLMIEGNEVYNMPNAGIFVDTRDGATPTDKPFVIRNNLVAKILTKSGAAPSVISGNLDPVTLLTSAATTF